ncbi:hypothetical protein GOODEAATRI_023094 [Goodea atripinnis]|uniref:Ig-like domain-containing protein n=1 Tax=Goodea atripinnis TaxID=208336 RepID=A0ABV0NX54_9TELE
MTDVRLSTATPSVCEVTASPAGSGLQSNEPPAFILPPRNVRVSLGGDARLEGKLFMFQVRGHPEPQVTWCRDGKAVIGGERYKVERGGRGNFSLSVGGVTEEDLGCYTCQATNQAGSRQVTVEILLEAQSDLNVSDVRMSHSLIPAPENRTSIWSKSPPKFISKPTRVFVRLGQNGKFSTKTTGRPQPQVTWYKGETELQPCGRISMYELSGRHFLEINDVQEEDAGRYTCSVINSAGTATASAELIVQGETTSRSLE